MSDGTISRTGVRWTCPICGTSRFNRSDDGSGEQRAVAALRSHVLASGGAGHGPVNEYPEGFDPDTLPDHVTRTHDRGNRVDADT